MTSPNFERAMAQLDGEFVVFLIGARINKPWAIHKWLPVALAMPKMIRELEQNPELGFLGCEQYAGRTTLMVQYWRSLDQLLAYARARNSEHLPAWRNYNERLRKSGVIGVWHETYVIKPGAYENVYVQMPPFGLARIAAKHGRYAPLRGGQDRARERLAAAPSSA